MPLFGKNESDLILHKGKIIHVVFIKGKIGCHVKEFRGNGAKSDEFL